VVHLARQIGTTTCEATRGQIRLNHILSQDDVLRSRRLHGRQAETDRRLNINIKMFSYESIRIPHRPRICRIRRRFSKTNLNNTVSRSNSAEASLISRATPASAHIMGERKRERERESASAGSTSAGRQQQLQHQLQQPDVVRLVDSLSAS